MLDSSLLSSWLDGAGAAVVAPGLSPRTLVEAAGDRRVLFVAADDASALLLGAALRCGVLLRTTGARERARRVERGGPLVTSRTSLLAPSLAALLTGELSEAAQVAWGFVRGGALAVLPTADGAPDGAERVAGSGAVRRSDDLAADLVGLGGGVLLGPSPAAESLGGAPLRHHSLARPFPRGWDKAEEALRRFEGGVDALELHPATVTVDGVPVATPGGAAFVAEGSVLLQGPEPDADADVDADAVDAARASLLRGGDAADPWLVARGADEALLRDLVAADALAELRPTWTRARVADGSRFRSPFVDAHGAWTAVSDRYNEARGAWSLADRGRFVLADNAPRDLVELAGELGLRPSLLADVLMDLVAADVVAARIEAQDGPEFEANPGPRFEAPAAELAEAINRARAARREARQRRVQALEAAACTTVGFRVAAGVPAGEPCGLCDRCDPSGEAVGKQAVSVHAPDTSADALFAGLGGAGAGGGGSVPDRGEGLANRLLAGDAAELLAELGPEVTAVLALFRHRGADGGREPSVADAEALLEVLRRQGEGQGLPEGVKAPRPGVFEFAGAEGARGSVFARRKGTKGLAGKVAGAVGGDGAAAALAGAWERAMAADKVVARLSSYLGAGLEEEFDVPVLATRALEGIEPSHREGDSRDAQLLRAVDGLATSTPTPVPEGAPIVSVLMAWMRSDPVELLELARPALQSKNAPLASRLAVRALARSEMAAPIAAKELRRWLESKELPPPQALLPWVQAVWSGRRGDIKGLAELLPEELHGELADAALRLGVLPLEMLGFALDRAAGGPEGPDPEKAADALIAVCPDARRAKGLILERADELALHRFDKLMAALQPRKGGVPKGLRSGLEARREALKAREAERQAIIAVAAEGRLGEAAERLAALPGQDALTDAQQAELASVRERAVARQSELVQPIAAVLAGATGEDAEDAAFAAIEDAVSEGFGKAVVALLSRQHRREPGDPARALWYARACCLAGDWLEGEEAYSVAAGLRSDPVTRVATEFEGLFMAFEEQQASRGLAWLERVLATPWHQVLLPQVTALVDEGVVPENRTVDLVALLEATGSPFYDKLLARLRG